MVTGVQKGRGTVLLGTALVPVTGDEKEEERMTLEELGRGNRERTKRKTGHFWKHRRVGGPGWVESRCFFLLSL